MSGIRSFYRGAAAKGYASAASAPIRVDSTSNTLKAIVAGSGTTEVEFLPTAVAPIPATASTLTLTAPLHSGRLVGLNLAAGIAVTLPAATGSGNFYELVVLATFTGAASIAVANASDYMIGLALLDKTGTVSGFPTANTGTVATESDTLSMFGTANANGGIKGAVYELRDIAANVWSVQIRSEAGGTVATPFSAAV